MIKSMTAYGRGMITLPNATFVVEITSVNRKNLDLSLTLPRDWLSLEVEIRKWIVEVAKRGSIIIKISKETSFENSSSLQLDYDVFKRLKDEIEKMQSSLELKQAISFEFLYEQATKLKGKELEISSDEIEGPVKEGLMNAVIAWDKMRQKEGSILYVDLVHRLSIIQDTVDKIKLLAPQTVKTFEEKLKKRLVESNFFQEGDFERICKEVLLYSDKIDITEEMTRLYSHLKQFIAEMDSQTPAIGKKLDFLMQEMHREANSLGVKCQDLEIIQLSVMIKSELEKIREQVQNIE